MRSAYWLPRRFLSYGSRFLQISVAQCSTHPRCESFISGKFRGIIIQVLWRRLIKFEYFGGMSAGTIGKPAVSFSMNLINSFFVALLALSHRFFKIYKSSCCWKEPGLRGLSVSADSSGPGSVSSSAFGGLTISRFVFPLFPDSTSFFSSGGSLSTASANLASRSMVAFDTPNSFDSFSAVVPGLCQISQCFFNRSEISEIKSSF